MRCAVNPEYPNLVGLMWRRLALFLVTGFLLFHGPAALAQTTLVLKDSAEFDISASSTMWIDPQGQTSIEQVVTSPRRELFVPSGADTVYALGRHAALWQKYRFARSAFSNDEWVLEFPQPLLDKITVYQLGASGRWASQTAGDTVDVSTWPEPGRYAQFRLELPEAGALEVYVRIQNVTSTSVPVKASTRNSQSQRLQMEYLAVGVVFGALLLLIVACVAQSWVYRDRAYGWYALYATTLTLMMSAWTGVAGHLLWSHAGAWNDLAPGFLGLLAGGAALLVVHHLCGVGSRHIWFESIVHWFGVAGLPVALIYALVERSLGVPMIGMYLVGVVVLGMTRAWTTWKRRDVIGLWVFAAFMPMALATLVLVSSVVGWVPTSWLSRYGLMAGLTIEVPLLLIALNLRSRERHSIEARAQALSSQDALTGLLTAYIFQDRLKQIVVRAGRYKEPAAVVYIELVNYRYIKKNWGLAVAEQSLLRSVIKLRRILRDVDTVGRVDEARFGLILEGVSSRTPVTALAARLIAAGLMPLKGLKPDVVLQFHVAGVLLGERTASETEIDQDLSDLLRHMGARTRRPIRFLEPELTRPMPLEADSGFDDADTGEDTTSPSAPFKTARQTVQALNQPAPKL